MRKLLALSLVVLSACGNPSLLIGGEPGPRQVREGPPLAVQVTDLAGNPLPDAAVEIDGEDVVLDATGTTTVEWPYARLTIAVSGSGLYETRTSVETYPESQSVRVQVEPVVLAGSVVSPAGEPVSGATVRLGEFEAVTDAAGSYRLERAVPGDLSVARPGYLPASDGWDGSDQPVDFTLEPHIVKGLHIVGWTPANAERWDNLLRIADETEINGLVVDLKDESGHVYFDTNVPLAIEVGAPSQTGYDIDEVVSEMRARDLYIIGRIVTFQDPLAARQKPDLSILDTTTGRPFTKNDQYFLDPTDDGARTYAIDLAVDACSRGFDEIQFDYVRFPDGFGTNVRFEAGDEVIGSFDDPESGAARVGYISSFLDEARATLHPLGCAVAADVFAYVMRTPDDQGIGQHFEEIVASVDVISPMIYPDHYGAGNFGFDRPKDHPGEVIDMALAEGMPRAAGSTVVRPWLADYHYEAAQVRAEIDSAEDYGLGWMLWHGSGSNRHTEGALLPDSGR